jgi:ABC-2 type transport system permease protein/lipopolysaccharide transport system permease protein
MYIDRASTAQPVQSWPKDRGYVRKAFDDLSRGYSKRWIWSALAFQDIIMRYRGSMLGPFWMTASTCILATLMGIIYPRLFNVTAEFYVPYLFVSMIIWQFIAALITDASTSFSSQAGIIQQVPLPLSLHAYRSVARGILVFAHSAAIIPFVLLIYRVPVSWRVIEVVPAFVALSINGVAFALVLGPMAARFRDLPPIITNFLQVAFFITPIFWPIELLGSWQIFAALNPLFAMVDVIRSPIIGHALLPTSWPVLLTVTLVNVGLSFAFFARFRGRIAYWI